MSGGADSLSLALLTRDWTAARGGSVLGLIVDHGLRRESAAEAAWTRDILTDRGIAAEVLTLTGLRRGAARARAARYAALEAACAARGILHLLLGHHAADQAETVLLRRAAGSGADGLAGMAALVERRDVRLLRPLLGVAPGRLRAGLRAVGVGWVEDPSNRDPASARVRLRLARGDDEGAGANTRMLLAEAAADGAARAVADAMDAAALAGRVALYAAGYAVVSPGALPVRAWAGLLRAIGGRHYTPDAARLAAAPAPGTLGGVRILPAGHWGGVGDLLVVREARAVAPPMPAVPGAVWDGRFRLGAGRLPPGAEIGALGADAPAIRRRLLPDAVARTLPAIRVAGKLLLVPHLGYPDRDACRHAAVMFMPPAPVAGAEFLRWREADLNMERP